MTEKEWTDYGYGISPLYAAENPVTYLPIAQFSAPLECPQGIIVKEAQPEQKIQPRQIIVAQPKVEYSSYKRLPFWRNLIIILQKWAPRIGSI
ncbi:hypothetical protein HYW46_04120 [Candidatus Daviesbacteria bacterium]|nr:hypothetical protein [Candidatus Daviesbacteria bacterium]